MKRREFGALLGGAMAVWPRASRAQARIYRIGFLTLEPGEDAALLARPLGELGYVEGRNLAIQHRSAGGQPARLAALADELVAAKPDVLVAGWGTLAPKALKAATTTLPIVFSTVGDPLGAGLVQSLARPGGNVTGLSGQSTEFKSKQLQLLLMAKPGQKAVGVLCNPDTPYSALSLKELAPAAAQAGVRLEVMEMRRPDEFSPARMEAMARAGAGSLLIVEDPLTSSLRDPIIAEAIRLRLPTMSGLPEFVRMGALMTYGTNQDDRYRQAAAYVARILKGANPADLPVEQPTKFHLTVNLKTAKAIGLSLPSSLQGMADEIIE